jgi:hypothetical protein
MKVARVERISPDVDAIRIDDDGDRSVRICPGSDDRYRVTG